MSKRLFSVAASTAIVFAFVSSASFAAGSATDAHAYFEGERTRTDGQTAPLDLRTAVGKQGGLAVRALSAADREFFFQLAHTDGTTGPTSISRPGRSTEFAAKNPSARR